MELQFNSDFKFQIAILIVFMCDVHLLAAFCSESVEYFRGMASKFFFEPFVNIPVASVILGLIIHSIFHIRCISIHKLLYFSFVSASFCVTFLSAGIAISISMHVLLLLLLLLLLSLLSLLFGSSCKTVLTKKFRALFQTKRRQRLSGFEFPVPFVFCFLQIRTTHCPRVSLLIIGADIFVTYYRRP